MTIVMTDAQVQGNQVIVFWTVLADDGSTVDQGSQALDMPQTADDVQTVLNNILATYSAPALVSTLQAQIAASPAAQQILAKQRAAQAQVSS